jgi:mannose-1-phosphate guanylyltransferase
MARKKSEKEIRAMVLAAGFGFRMQNGGEQRPKPLVELCGRPLILYPLMLLRQNGFEEVVINLHHRADEIKDRVGSGKKLGIKIRYIRELEILGTGGGIKNADEKFPARKWLTLNADTVIGLDLKKFIQAHDRRRAFATMALTPAQRGKFSPVFADSRGRVRGIGSRPRKASAGLKNYSYTGVQVISRELLEFLPGGYSKIIEHAYLPALQLNKTIRAYLFRGLWLSVDHPAALALAQKQMDLCADESGVFPQIS